MVKKCYDYPSPNFNTRPANIQIDTIVIHYTEVKDDITALNVYMQQESQISPHYVVNKKGKIFSVVPDEFRAWHAGPSCWRGREKVNDFSIGIELDNNGRENFSQALMDSLIELCHELIKSYPIDQFNIVGHSDIIPSRKFDPGRLFNWKLLAQNNIGIFPLEVLQDDVQMPELHVVQSMLNKYGYKIDITNKLDQLTIDVMRAFNEHFNPECLKHWNSKSFTILRCLNALL
jgi:N-acetylmuramoyl-L-alanine amidase